MTYALMFDFGGVLMKTVDRAPRLVWDDRLGLAHGSVEQVVHGSHAWRRAQLGQLSVADYWADVAARLKISETAVMELERDYFSGDRLDTEIVSLLRRLKAAGQRIALLSNDSPALIYKLTALGIADLFDPLVISAQIGAMKPSPAAYLNVIARLKCAPSDAVFVDDVAANVEGARAVGMIAIHYTPEMDLERALAPYV